MLLIVYVGILVKLCDVRWPLLSFYTYRAKKRKSDLKKITASLQTNMWCFLVSYQKQPVPTLYVYSLETHKSQIKYEAGYVLDNRLWNFTQLPSSIRCSKHE